MGKSNDNTKNNKIIVSFLRSVVLIALLIASAFQLAACAPKMTKPISKDDDMTVESDTGKQADENEGKLKHYPVVL